MTQMTPEKVFGPPLRMNNHSLPGLWRHLLPAQVQAFQFPHEKASTCMSCPKAKFEQYRPDYRCCTYLPRVPNFMLGGQYLVEPDASVIDTIKNHNLLLPEGMVQSPKQWIDYLDDLEHDRFGKSKKYLCPLLERDTGYCGIHNYRNSVCSTFFCEKDHGSRSEKVWESLQVLVGQVEISLSHWALEESGFSVSDYIARLDSLSDDIRAAVDPKRGSWSDEALRTIWGDWYGQERDLMVATARQVVTHHDVLWDIAEQSDILEAKEFDRASLRIVPKRLKGQIDPADFEDGEAVPPSDLWKKLLKAHRQLWELPSIPLAVSSRVEIVPNPLSSVKDRSHSQQPYKLNYLVSRGSKKVDWEDYLSEPAVALLREFKEPKMASWNLLKTWKHQGITDPKRLVLSYFHRKILVAEPQV